MMSKRIVSNTGPLIGLALIDRLELLHALYDEVIIPRIVHEEMLQGGTDGHCGRTHGILHSTSGLYPAIPCSSSDSAFYEKILFGFSCPASNLEAFRQPLTVSRVLQSNP